MEVSPKLKIEIPFDPGIPLLGIYSKKTRSLIQKDICTPMFITALLKIAKIWKQLKCPLIDEWIYDPSHPDHRFLLAIQCTYIAYTYLRIPV